MERYVKVNGKVHTESELYEMNEKQLKDLIKECQEGIEEIERKSEDYKVHNYDESNIEHYNQVLAKFKSASIFLQSDIVLINNILKLNKPNPLIMELNWYKEYYKVINSCTLKCNQRKAEKIVTEKLGYSL